MPDDPSMPVGVFSGNPWDAGMVKNLLENEGIISFLKDETLGRTTEWISGSGGNMGVVAQKDIKEAQKVVKGFLGNKPSLK